MLFEGLNVNLIHSVFSVLLSDRDFFKQTAIQFCERMFEKYYYLKTILC